MNFIKFAFRNLLILRLTVPTSKLYFIFHIFEHYFCKMFCAISPIVWPWTVTIYVFRLLFWCKRCAVLRTITGSGSPSCSCSSSSSSLVRLYGICCRSSLWVLTCAVVSHDVVGCSSQYWRSSSSLNFGLC